MSPKTKKLLMVAGAAVAGYVVYTKVAHKSAAAAPQVATAPTKTPLAITKDAAIAQIRAAVMPKLPGLGSLGGSCF